MTLLHDLLDAEARRRPHAPALKYRGSCSSYAQLQSASQRTALGLQRLGIGPGDRVAVHLSNRPEAIELALACSRLGAVFVPLNPALRLRQLSHVLKDSGARALITSGGVVPQLRAAELPDLRFIAVADTPVDDQRFAEQVSLHRLLDLRIKEDWTEQRDSVDTQLAALFYTSGSTGRSKGVMLSHRNLVTGARSVSQYLGNRDDDRILAVLPWSFDYGFNQVATALNVGACAVLSNYSSPAALVSELYEEDVTALAGVPTIWAQLAAARWPESPPPSLRYITNSGGTLHRATIVTLQSRLPATRIFCMYGLTEAFRSTFLDPSQLERRMGSIGKAVPGQEIVIVHESGRLCGPNEVGELVHRGSFVSMGYWNDPELTAACFRPFPFPRAGHSEPELAVWSGDLARIDEEGYLYFLGRRDHQIKTSGFRVSPTEIEEVVAELAGVVESVAVGVPDEVLGQKLVLHVIAQGEVADIEDRLRDLCRRQLPAYVSISRVVFHSTLPRTASGKPDRSALAEASRLDQERRDAPIS